MKGATFSGDVMFACKWMIVFGAEVVAESMGRGMLVSWMIPTFLRHIQPDYDLGVA